MGLYSLSVSPIFLSSLSHHRHLVSRTGFILLAPRFSVRFRLACLSVVRSASLTLLCRTCRLTLCSGCSVFLPRPTGSIKTTKCCLSIRCYAHSWSTTLLRHSPGGTGLPTLSQLPLSISLSSSFTPFNQPARSLLLPATCYPLSSSFFVLLSQDLRIHGRPLRFLIISA